MALTFQEYQKLAIRTLPPADHPGGHISTLALGLAGEAAECAVAMNVGNFDKIIKEIGDVYWYIATIMYRYNIQDDPNKATFVEGAGSTRREQIMVYGGLAADMVKKHTGHLHKLDVDALAGFVLAVKAALDEIVWCNGFSFEVIALRNDAKLRLRFPDGFTSEASINRPKD